MTPGSLHTTRRASTSTSTVRMGAAELGPRPTAPGEDPALAPGTRFGRYTLLEKIGEGAMGVVFSAYDISLDRKVAVKLVRAAQGEGEEVRASVQREAQALARVSHPNVVQIFEVGTYLDYLFVAMEHVEGHTLAAWLLQRHHGIEQILSVFVQAGRGLVAAHTAGVIHRDFKPANVIVGADGRARLVDFGLARVLVAPADPDERSPTASSDLARTAGGAVLGTPAYMSPEQHRGGSVDERSDQFNFCAALFEALYGLRPFAGATLEEIRERVLAGEIRAAPPGAASPAIHAALLRGLAPDKAQRWPSLTALLDRLERFDPARDPTSARSERRAFGLLLIGAILALAAFLDYEELYEPAFLTPGHVLAVGACLLAATTLGAWRSRTTLMRDAYHKSVVQALLLLLAVEVVARWMGALAGLPVATMLFVDALCTSMVSAALGLFVVRFFRRIAAVQLLAALLLALSATSPVLTVTSALALSAALFVHGWERAVVLSTR